MKHLPKKKFGQIFLNNDFIIKKIVKDANIENKNVVEIGPGKGALTALLLDQAKHVTAYEIDNDLIPILKKKFKSKANFDLKHEDFLKTKIESKIDIVANIPYNITSSILFKIFDNINDVNSATLMVQKEVADRLKAKVGSSSYGKLTVVTNFYSDKIESIIFVPKINFDPVPKVNSEVIKLLFKKEIKYSIEEQNEFLNFVKKCFFSQRKTLINNLLKSYENVKIDLVYNELHLDKKIRPQQVSEYLYLKLWKKFKI